MRRAVVAVVVGVLMIVGSGVSAQEVFLDGFEWASICAWDNDLWYPDFDEDLYGDDQASGISLDCPPSFGMVDNNFDCDDLVFAVNPDATELCDGSDNDCNGASDEGFNLGDPCDGEGECGAGVVECSAAGGSQCSTEPGGSSDQSSVEQCDGLDNDCDGVDDNVAPQECYTGPPGTLGVGECSTGTQSCSGTFWGPCEGEVLPTIEQCFDGKDNDCDGFTDGEDPSCSR